MSYTSDPAEQVVRLSLEGAELAAKLTGAGAKQLAIILAAMMRDTRKTKGKARLSSMLRSGRPLKVFAVQDKDLAVFCKEAKKYGVLYCALKDRDANDGITDVMVRAEDAAKVNRIFERFKLTAVDMAAVKSEAERGGEGKGSPDQDRDVFLDAMLRSGTSQEDQDKNPTMGRTGRYPQSVPSSTHSAEVPEYERPSVRSQLKAIRKGLGKSVKKERVYGHEAR